MYRICTLLYSTNNKVAIICNKKRILTALFNLIVFAVDSDVNHTLNITGAKVQVCFETKWDLNKCIDLDTSNSCTGYSVTFKGDPCKKSIPFTLPPGIYCTY